MYPNAIEGHFHPPDSRFMIATVDRHCRAKAKNRISATVVAGVKTFWPSLGPWV